MNAPAICRFLMSHCLVACMFAFGVSVLSPLALAQLADERQDETQPLPDVQQLEREAVELVKRAEELIGKMEKLKGRRNELPEQLQQEIAERKFHEEVQKLEQATFEEIDKIDERFAQLPEALHRIEEMLHRQGEKLHFERERHEEFTEELEDALRRMDEKAHRFFEEKIHRAHERMERQRQAEMEVIEAEFQRAFEELKTKFSDKGVDVDRFDVPPIFGPGPEFEPGQEPAREHEVGGPEVGEPAPELTVKLLRGKKKDAVSIKSLRGNVVVVEFWATWCGPCVDSIPHMNDLVEATKKDKIEFLAISSEEREDLENFFDESKVKMKSWVAMDREETTMRAYNIKALPTAVVIDKAGKVIAVTHPGDLTVEKLRAAAAGESVEWN